VPISLLLHIHHNDRKRGEPKSKVSEAMARVEAVVVCLLIVAMDVAAGVLGIHAEKAQNQVNRV
jgi:hypothetical protein